MKPKKLAPHRSPPRPETPLKKRGVGVERTLSAVRAVHSPKQARSWLQLSLAEVGREVARLIARKRAFDKTTVLFWERGGPTSAEVRQAYATLIANQLTQRLARVVAVKLIANSPWHITAWTQCVECGQWFELMRRTQKRCGLCGKRK